MATRKSPSERVAEFKSKAAQIEERERRKLLRKAPQWTSTLRAINAIRDALGYNAAGEDDPEFRAVLDAAEIALGDFYIKRVGDQA